MMYFQPISDSKSVSKMLLIFTLLFASNSSYSGPPPGAGPGGGTTATKINCDNNLTATWVTDMAFGTLDAGTGGTLDLAATSDTVLATGGVTAVTGSFISRGAIEVTNALAGCDAFPLTITYTTATITGPSTATMSINRASFSSFPAAPLVDPVAGIISTIFIGANLTVTAGQTPETYTGPLSITVKH